MRDLELVSVETKICGGNFYGSNYGIQVISLVSRFEFDRVLSVMRRRRKKPNRGLQPGPTFGVCTIDPLKKAKYIDLRYLGRWQTPWEDGVDKGPKTKGRLYRERHDQSPRLRRELEQQVGQRRRRQHG